MNILERLCKWYLEKNKYFKVLNRLEYDILVYSESWRDVKDLPVGSELGMIGSVRIMRGSIK